jgi:hypothetical protein
VDIWWAALRVIHCPNTDESDCRSGLRIVAPNGYLASGTARNPLSPATTDRRCVDQLGFAANVLDPIGLIQSIQRVRAPRLALAPSAVAGMNNEWYACQTISNIPACASTVHVTSQREQCGIGTTLRPSYLNCKSSTN